jgi:hypothetical protein
MLKNYRKTKYVLMLLLTAHYKRYIEKKIVKKIAITTYVLLMYG